MEAPPLVRDEKRHQVVVAQSQWKGADKHNFHDTFMIGRVYASLLHIGQRDIVVSALALFYKYPKIPTTLKQEFAQASFKFCDRCLSS